MLSGETCALAEIRGAAASSFVRATRGSGGPFAVSDFRKRRFSSQYPAKEFARTRCSPSEGAVDLVLSDLPLIEGLIGIDVGEARMYWHFHSRCFRLFLDEN